MRISGFDEDDFSVVGRGSLFECLQACMRSLLTECDVMYIDEYPPNCGKAAILVT